MGCSWPGFQKTPLALQLPHPSEHLQKRSLRNHNTETEKTSLGQEQELQFSDQISIRFLRRHQLAVTPSGVTVSFSQISAQALMASEPFPSQDSHTEFRKNAHDRQSRPFPGNTDKHLGPTWPQAYPTSCVVENRVSTQKCL